MKSINLKLYFIILLNLSKKNGSRINFYLVDPYLDTPYKLLEISETKHFITNIIIILFQDKNTLLTRHK